MPRKKRKLIHAIILISIIIVILAIAGIVYYLYMNTDMFKSNQTLFQKYLAQNLQITSQLFENNSSTNLEESMYTSSSEIGINYISGIGTSNENRESTVNNGKIVIESQNDDMSGYQYKDIKLQDQEGDLASIEYINDGDLEGIRLQGIMQFVTTKDIAQLSETLELPIDDAKKILILKEIPEMKEIFNFSEEEINTLKQTYVDILNQYASRESYRKENKTITSSENTISVIGYYTTMTKEQYNNLRIAILEKIKTDEILLNKIEQIQTKLSDYNISIGEDGKSLEEQMAEQIDTIIEEIKSNNIGSEEVKLEVCVNNGRVVRTEITMQGYSFAIKLENSNVIEIEELDETGSVQTSNTVSIKKQSEDVNQNVEIDILTYINGVKNKEIKITNDRKEENGGITNNAEFYYSEEENELTLTLDNSIKIVDNIEDKIELNSENNITIEDLDENSSNNIVNILKEQIQTEENNILAKISLDDINLMLKNLGIIKQDIIRDEPATQITETERNRFNSNLTFFIGKEKPLSEVQALLETIKNDLKDATILREKKRNSEEEQLVEIDLDIERNSQNEEKLQEIMGEIQKEENANLKYDITMGYDEETQLINKIYIKVMRE